MQITLITVGKLKETYWREAVSEYTKRLGAFCKLTIIEIPEEKAPEKASPANETAIKQKEGTRILQKIAPKDFVVVLDVCGKPLTSPTFAAFLDANMVQGIGHMVFVIGGSLGLSPAVNDRGNGSISFSNLTFTHQMMRVMFLEQLYRCFKILAGEPYHK